MKLFKVILIFFSVNLCSQNNLCRVYPQVVPATTLGLYTVCNLAQMVKTLDGGYIISCNPWQPNLHNAYPVDFITIKTNSVYVPQWKKVTHVKSLVLATGGIINIHYSVNNPLYQISQISKITAGGNTQWTKTFTISPSSNFNYNLQINDMVTYNNKICCVGQVFRENSGMPSLNGFNNFIAEMDTLGNLLSINQGASNCNLSSFSRVFKNISGDFIIADDGCHQIHKYNSAFNHLWSIDYGSIKCGFSDMYVQTNGDMFCLFAANNFSSGNPYSILMRIGAGGNFISSKEINLEAVFSGMEKVNNGNYVLSGLLLRQNASDTLKNFIMMVDSNANFIWARKQMPSIGISKILFDSNKLFFSTYFNNLVVESGDLNGNFPCTNIPFNVALTSTVIAFTSLTVTLTQTVMPFTNSNTYTNSSQNYRDTCGGFPFSIKENTRQNFKISPNPSNGKIYIKSDHSLDGYQIRISSVEGKLLRELFLEEDTVEINDLSQGIYFLTFVKDGLFVESKKVIITK